MESNVHANEIKYLGVIHITHNDADAVGCAVVAAILLPQFDFLNNTYFCAIGTQDEKLNSLLDEYDEKGIIPDLVVISDISISKETAIRLKGYKDRGTNLIGVDHHGTNTIRTDEESTLSWFTVLSGNCIEDWRFPDEKLKISAAMILDIEIRKTMRYDKNLNEIFIHNREKAALAFEVMIDMISRYDTWEWKEHPYDYTSNPKLTDFHINYQEDIFNEATRFLGTERAFCELYEHFNKFTKDIVDLPLKVMPIPEIFLTIYNINKNKREKYLKELPEKTRIRLDSSSNHIIASFVNENDFTNAASEYLYNLLDEIDYVEILYPSSNTVSYRTYKNTINLGLLAKNNYGGKGGGHDKAAGTKEIPDDTYASIMLTFYHSMKLSTYLLRKETESTGHIFEDCAL